MNWYTGTKLLAMADLDGERPEIFMCNGNRSAGKTTWFNHKLVDDFLDHDMKFGVYYRFMNELSECSGKFFKDIGKLFYPNMNMEHKLRDGGSFAELFLDGKECGYAIPINAASKLKKMSHYLSDIGQIVFDEYQSEDCVYCQDEVKKFHGLHQSIARGNGSSSRYVPVYMLSNSVTALNPYYAAFGITGRLNPDTKFIRGHGWVMEQAFIKDAYNQIKRSAFEKCFVENEYIDMGKDGKHLLDSDAFIVQRPKGQPFRYYCTLIYQNKVYSLKIYDNLGIIFCDVGGDLNYKYKIAVDDMSHSEDGTRLQNDIAMIELLRSYYQNGCFRFLNIEAKNCIMKMIRFR